MKTFLMIMLIVFVALPVHSQLAKGPRSGSISGGVIVSTDTFPLTPKTVRSLSIKSRREIHPPPISQPASVTYVNAIPPLIVEDKPNGVADSVTKPAIVHDFEGIPDIGTWPPPDPIIAVGPNHVMTCVNTRFRISDKQGTTTKTIDAADWYSTTLLPRDWFIFDPKIRYDHFANRWLMVWLVDDGVGAVWGDTAYFLISVSDDENPYGTWYNWAIPSNTVGDSVVNNGADYEGVGFDESAIYISSNQYHPPEGTYQYVKVRIFDKAQFYANTAGSITWTDFWDLRDPANTSSRIMTARPAIVFGTPGQYFLVNNIRNDPGTYYTLWKISNPLASPSITAVNIPASMYQYQIYADQLGGGTQIANSSGKLRNEPVYRDSSLWVVHCVASGSGNTYASIRYLRLNPFTNTLMEDVQFGKEGYWYLYPALMVDKNKNLMITYSRSSATEYVGAFLCGRRDSDPPGLSTSVPLKYGESNYVRLDWWGNNRWGDYMGAALDPTDEEAIWAFTEYAASPANTWGTWVGKVKVPDSNAAYAQTVEVNKTYFSPGEDTVWLRAHVMNPYAHPLTIKGYFKAGEGIVDSSVFYDDGYHHDSLAGDGVWGALWETPATENIYNVNIKTFDPTDNSSYQLLDVCRFATAGPVAFDHVSRHRGATSYSLTPYYKNNGYTIGVSGLTVNLKSNNQWIYSITPYFNSLPDLPAGDIKIAPQFSVLIDTSTFPGYMDLYTEVSHEGWALWQDSIRVMGLCPITATISGQGTISPSGTVNVDYGSDTTFTIVANIGSHLDTLFVDGVKVDSTTTYTFYNVIRNHIIHAKFKITTYTISASAGLHGTITPFGDTLIPYGGSQRYLFMPDPGYYVDSVIVDGEPVDSSDGYTFTNVFEPHMIRVVFASLTTVEWTVDAQWNLISLPVQVLECLTDSLFGSATSDAYEYDAQYISRDTLINGKGYWLKFSGAENESMTGNCIVSDTVDVNEGWNLIGSISYPVPVTTVLCEDTTMTTGSFFGYNGGYYSTDTIYPGRGCWVKVTKDGRLILSSSQFIVNASYIKIIHTMELPPAPPGGKESVMASDIPDEYLLEQNYPNPFNPTTTFKFGIPERSRITFEIYNVLGQIVTTLINGECESGYHSMEWIATNGIGSGLYFYRLTASSMVKPGRMFVQVRKMVLVK